MMTPRRQTARVAVCILASLVLHSDAKNTKFIDAVCKVGMKQTLLNFASRWIKQIMTDPDYCEKAHGVAVKNLNMTEEKALELKVRCLDKLGAVIDDTYTEQLKNQTELCLEELKTDDSKYTKLTASATEFSESNALGAIFSAQLEAALKAENKSFFVEEKLEEEGKDEKVRLFSDTFYLPRVDSERAAVASLAGGALVAMVGFGALLRRGTAREQTGQERLVSGTTEAADA